jgi:Hypoxia induced protein conserved region
MTLLDYLVPFAVGVVFIVLLLGLWNMLPGGSANTSQRLMRLRVLAQFLAIILILLTVYFANR